MKDQRSSGLTDRDHEPRLAGSVCRVLPHLVSDGPTNMALDEALLDSVAADPSMSVIRTYEWTSPTLSLGYFQKVNEFESDRRWDSVPIVRRPTGGGALWHDAEITYAVVIPVDHPSARPSKRLYQSIHESIVVQLNAMGIPATRRGAVEFDEELANRHRPFLCFTDRDSEDVVFRNVKLVGSAQRRRAGAILQHGSLLLRRSKQTPELPGLTDLATIVDSTRSLITLMQSTLAETLGLPVVEDDLIHEELRRAEILRETVYANSSWTRKR